MNAAIRKSQSSQTTAKNQTLRGPVSHAVDTFDAGSSTMSFRHFYRSRQASRQEDFNPSKKKSSSTAKQIKKSADVQIKVGLTYMNGGVFRTRRRKGRLIKKAVEKHSSFDQSSDSVSPYVLLYPDFSEVFFVPGTEETFSILKYKEAIGKGYKQRVFISAIVTNFRIISLLTILPKKNMGVHRVAQVSTECESASNCADIVPATLIMEDDDDGCPLGLTFSAIRFSV